MSAPKPMGWREPNCEHSSPEFPQPASACRICKDGPVLAQWVREWDAWLAENPNSFEATQRREWTERRPLPDAETRP